MSYLIYKDKINFIQGLGLAVILIGVVVISIFKAEPIEVIDSDGLVIEEVHPLYKFGAIITGLMAASSFGGEVILVKELTKMKVDGD